MTSTTKIDVAKMPTLIRNRIPKAKETREDIIKELNNILNDEKATDTLKRAATDVLNRVNNGEYDIQVGDTFEANNDGKGPNLQENQEPKKTEEELEAERKAEEKRLAEVEKQVVKSAGDKNLKATKSKHKGTDGKEYTLYQEAFATGDREYKRLFFVKDGKLMELNNAQLVEQNKKLTLVKVNNNANMEAKAANAANVKNEVDDAREEAKDIPSTTYDINASRAKMKAAKESSEVIAEQIEAVKTGIQLRKDATRVKLEKFSEKLNNGWKAYVENYLDGEYTTYLSSTVQAKGANYDFEKGTFVERVLDQETDGTKFRDELAEKSMEDLLTEVLDSKDSKGKAIKVDLTNIGATTDDKGNLVGGVDLTQLKNITLEDNNETIGERGKQLSKALEVLNGYINVITPKRDATKSNLTNINSRIEGQEKIIEAQVEIIKKKLEAVKNTDKDGNETIDSDSVLLKAVEDGKVSIDDEEAENYSPQARAAMDRKILKEYTDIGIIIKTSAEGEGENAKTTYSLDFEAIAESLKKGENETEAAFAARKQRLKNNASAAQEAFERLDKRDAKLGNALTEIGKAAASITDRRAELVQGLQELAKYEVALAKLGSMTKDLQKMATQLNTTYDYLSDIDKFNEEADQKVGNKDTKGTMFYKEKKAEEDRTTEANTRAKKGEDRNQESRDAVEDSEKGDKQRTRTDNKDAGINKSSKGKSQKGADIATGGTGFNSKGRAVTTKIDKQKDAEAVVNRHDIRLGEYNALRKQYDPQKEEGDAPSPTAYNYNDSERRLLGLS